MLTEGAIMYSVTSCHPLRPALRATSPTTQTVVGEAWRSHTEKSAGFRLRFLLFHYRHRPVMAARTSISMDCIFLWVARPLSMSTWVKPPSWVQTMRLVRPSVSSSTAM